jgi:hypothetical protein
MHCVQELTLASMFGMRMAVTSFTPTRRGLRVLAGTRQTATS